MSRTPLTAAAVAVLTCSVHAEIMTRIDVAADSPSLKTKLAEAIADPPMGQPGLRISPSGEGEIGYIEFEAEVKPDEQTYLTVRAWGSEPNPGPVDLALVEGEKTTEVGRVWWRWARDKANAYAGRWIYRTIPIPVEVTSDKTSLTLRLTSDKPGYAIYGIFTHTGPYFEIPEDHEQGEPFVWGPSRPMPEGYPGIKARMKERALNDIEFLINEIDMTKGSYTPRVRRITQGLNALAEVYHTEWSGHYQDESLLVKIRGGLDSEVQRLASRGGDPGAMYYRGWTSFGNVAKGYFKVHEQFEELGWLEEEIELPYPNGPVMQTRRKAYADFFHAGYEWRRMDRRDYTNQPLHIARTFYATQKALRKLGDPRALTQKQALRYIHEGVGYVPLLTRKFAIEGYMNNYAFYTVTKAGLTQELGYVDGYGELSKDFVHHYYLTGGDEAVKEQSTKLTDTRAYFRIPVNDADGYATLRGIGIISWRGNTYPFRIEYGGIYEAAALESDATLRLAQLEIEHGRPYLYKSEAGRNVHWDTVTQMKEYEAYLKIKDLPKTDYRLPMEPGQPDFVFGDSQNGTYCFKHGETRVYGSFFHNTPYAADGKAIANLAPIRMMAPRVDRYADVHFEAYAPESGFTKEFKFPFGTRTYPQAPPPPGIDRWENIPPNSIDRTAGLAYFYRLHYGDYLIAMNCTQTDTYRENTYTLDIPEGVTSATNLHTGETVDLSRPFEVGPETTVVLLLNTDKEAQ